MNKQELIKSIEAIPKFRLRDVAVKKEGHHNNLEEEDIKPPEWFEQEENYAVTDVSNYKALAFVGKKYHLVQFSQIYLPIINNMPEVEGEVLYDNGYGYLYLFPVGEKYKEGQDEFGITVINSVNCSASVIINFIVKHDDKKIMLPAKISGFKRNHKGATTLDMAKDYLYAIDKVKDIWARIITKFTQESLSEKYIEDLNLGKKISKGLIEKMENVPIVGEMAPKLNLWDAFMYALEHINSRNYKTEVHRRKKLDKVCETIIEYGFVLGI